MSSPLTAEENGAEAPADDRVNILIVDDRPDKLLSLEAVVQGLNENIVRATSGREALRCLLQQDFAVILLDVNMPIMDGFETAALIRQRARTEHTPIIFISAVNDTENHVSRGYSLGAVDYILTPIVPEILRAKIAVFVDLFRKTEQVKRQADERTRLAREQAARVEAESAQQRAAFLAEASNVLAGSLEFEGTFAALAQLVVPKLADYCIVDMVQEDGTPHQVAVAHREPGQEQAVRNLRERYPFKPDLDFGVAKVLRTGEAELCAEVTDELLERFSENYDRRLSHEELAFSSYIVVPLATRGRTLGALSIVGMGTRSYNETDLLLATELGQRVALALDNAGLYKAAQKAREEAERANVAKDQFLAMLSHELRTPLTPVLTTIMSMEGDPELPPQFLSMIRMIRRNVELESRLIDDLLDLTRISKGKIRLSLENVDIHELLRNTLEICAADLQEKKLRVHENFAADRFRMRADPARMQQIFWNLIKNAVKFTPPGGELFLDTCNLEQALLVEVRDTGQGIEPRLLPRIFDAFEQGERAQAGGLGLGLAITKALVDLHGGRISAESEGKSKGANFLVELPVPRQNLDEGGPAETGDETPDWAPLRILLVDDHVDTNSSLTRLLSRRGYEVQCAHDVASALQIAGDYNFDVLMSDMGLPDGTGIDLIQRLQETGRPVRGIALSGFGMEEDLRRSKEAGFSEHLVKPVDLNSLDAVLQQVGREPRG